MATITQRLIAAGASPERARAFEQQFTQRVQAAQPGLSKPQDIQDAFDQEIAALAPQFFPNVFRPPAPNDPRIDDYLIGAYGKNPDDFRITAFVNKAPDLYRILKAYPSIQSTPDEKLPLDAYIVKKLYIEQKPVGEVKQLLSSGALKDPSDPTGKKLLVGALLPSEYGSLVDRYAGQDAAQLEEETRLKTNFLENDKYYKASLPTPKLTYGKTENLKEGKIAYTTHPAVQKYLETEGVRAKQLAQTAPAGYIGASGGGEAFNKMREQARTFEDRLFNSLLKSGAAPFKDEVTRREALKNKTLLK